MNLPDNYVILGKGGSFQMREGVLLQDQGFTGAMSIDGENWGAEERVSGRSTSIHYAAPLNSDVARINGHHPDPGHGTFRGFLQGDAVDTGTGVNSEYTTPVEVTQGPELDEPKFDRYSEMREAIRNARTIAEIRSIVKADWEKSKAATQISPAWDEIEVMGVDQRLAENAFPESIPEAITVIEGKTLPEMPVDYRTAPPGPKKAPSDGRCPKCLDKGHYSYDENHAKPCEMCCTHDQGWWELKPHFSGYVEGGDNRCCRNGCGTLHRELK